VTSSRHVRFTPDNRRWTAHPSQHLAVCLLVCALATGWLMPLRAESDCSLSRARCGRCSNQAAPGYFLAGAMTSVALRDVREHELVVSRHLDPERAVIVEGSNTFVRLYIVRTAFPGRPRTITSSAADRMLHDEALNLDLARFVRRVDRSGAPCGRGSDLLNQHTI
jgi:hypothetical protein